MKNNSKEVILEFSLPGFNRKDIGVKLFKNRISVKAQKKHQKQIQKKDFYHAEKGSQHFNYTSTVPKINPRKAKITFKSGVLKIIAPKA